MPSDAAPKFASSAAKVAQILLGDPNRHLSTRTNLRYGSNGSLSLDVQKGTWYDHEQKLGGGVLDLIERETGRTGKDAVSWLEEYGFDVGGEGKPAASDGGRGQGARGGGAPRQGPGRQRDERHDAPRVASRAQPGSRWPRGIPDHARLVGTFDYDDMEGKLRQQVVRFEWQDEEGKRHKSFRQRRPGTKEGQWIWSVKDIEQIPYRLGELEEAIASDVWVFFVEGEKCVEALLKLGVPATCNAMGAGKWWPELTPHFEGARICILPDNDEAGRAHRDLVGKELLAVAQEVRVLELPGLGDKGDVADWLAAGGDAEQLYDMLQRDAWPWTEDLAFRSRFSAVPWHRLDEPGPEHEWLVKGLLTRGERSMCAGPSQSGKSFFALDIAMSVARGVDYSAYSTRGRGYEVRPHKTRGGLVIYQAGEGGRGIKKRLRAYREARGIDAKQALPFVLMPASLNLYDNDEQVDAFIDECLFWQRRYGQPLELIVIDTFSTATPGANENSSEDVSRVLKRCERICDETGAHVMLVHHMNAQGEKPRGHTSIFANLDNVLICSKQEGLSDKNGRQIREVKLAKQKDGEDGLTIRFVLKQVKLGQDADGDWITSCACEPPELTGADEQAGKITDQIGERLSAQAKVFIRAVYRALDDFGQPAPASLKLPAGLVVVEWKHVREAFFKLSFAGDDEADEEKRRAAMRQAVKRQGEILLGRGFIAREGRFVWLTGKRMAGIPAHRVGIADNAEPWEGA